MKKFAIAALSIALAGCNMGTSVESDVDMDDMDNGGMEMDAGADVMVN